MQTRAEKRTEIAAKVALQQRKQLEEIEPVTHRNVYCSWKKGGHSFGKKAYIRTKHERCLTTKSPLFKKGTKMQSRPISRLRLMNQDVRFTALA